MELYDTEEQTVEAIRDWWKENGKAVIVGAVLGLGGLLGWNYYQDSQTTKQENASTDYAQTMQVLSEDNAKSQAQVQDYIDANKDTAYAVLASMQLAKVQVEAGELKKALTQLKWAQSHTDDQALKPVIAVRIARVESELKQYDNALATLKNVKAKGWEGRIDELRGDILLAKGDKSGAYSAYSQAQQAKDVSQTLQMKLDDLAK
ncbi:YfgM family protein [Vibrio zhugei]|uniref:Ancillary SecYEG translocon subunit n=1 Tax=Vibrio zhugei TaxID=2479546 RepID=A0ABV7CA94_9VIBR|nr:YfgM family protein [Vibrio zhugei]